MVLDRHFDTVRNLANCVVRLRMLLCQVYAFDLYLPGMLLNVILHAYTQGIVSG